MLKTVYCIYGMSDGDAIISKTAFTHYLYAVEYIKKIVHDNHCTCNKKCNACNDDNKKNKIMRCNNVSCDYRLCRSCYIKKISHHVTSDWNECKGMLYPTTTEYIECINCNSNSVNNYDWQCELHCGYEICNRCLDNSHEQIDGEPCTGTKEYTDDQNSTEFKELYCGCYKLGQKIQNGTSGYYKIEKLSIET